MSEQDDVMELLDSIDKPKGQRRTPRTASKKKRHNEDIMDFLDEIASEGTPGGTPASTPAPPAEAAPEAKETAAATEPSSEDLVAPKQDLPDPIGAVSSWWNRAKPGLWEHATKAASRASEAVKSEHLSEHLTKIDLNSLQKSFSTLVSEIVPPISAHEQLGVHVFHDLAGYPMVDEIVRTVFERVMDQVEGGGELNMIVQKGIDRHAASSGKKSLNLFEGTLDNAKKLCLASVDDFRRDHKSETEIASENARLSEIYISIQAVLVDGAQDDERFQFVCCMSDFTNKVFLNTQSQCMPAQWASWLDSDEEAVRALIADPRPWVLEWLEDSLSLALGTLAQRYVILRMGLRGQDEGAQEEA